jgi:hypothetical protein
MKRIECWYYPESMPKEEIDKNPTEKSVGHSVVIDNELVEKEGIETNNCHVKSETTHEI